MSEERTTEQVDVMHDEDAGIALAEEEDQLKVKFELIETIESASPFNAVSEYQSILNNDRFDDIAVKVKEQCLYKLTRLHTEAKQFDDVLKLLNKNSALFESIPKARTAKIVRNVIEIVALVPNSLEIQISLCTDVIEWCKIEKRTFLRQRIEAKLAGLLLKKNEPENALVIITSLLKELKKLDDKQMLTEVHLTESRIYQSLQNIPKAKSSLTACRTSANSIYVTPLLQAELDEMSGVLLCEEGDHVTAYSYFLEAFESYDQAADRRAITCLQYMCLCKVLQDSPGEVASVITSRTTSKVLSTPTRKKEGHVSTAGGDALLEMQAMVAVAAAAKERSLEEFQKAVTEFSVQLRGDALISHHLDLLYERMLETNLLKIIQPFSCVEVVRVAELIKLPVPQVERKLSQMILDERFSGILDQGKGHLVVYSSVKGDPVFARSIEVIANLGVVVEALSQRAKSLSKTVS